MNQGDPLITAFLRQVIAPSAGLLATVPIAPRLTALRYSWHGIASSPDSAGLLLRLIRQRFRDT